MTGTCVRRNCVRPSNFLRSRTGAGSSVFTRRLHFSRAIPVSEDERDLGVPKTPVNSAAAPRSVEHAALGAPVRRTPARPRPP
jgi:hypothetical protein